MGIWVITLAVMIAFLVLAVTMPIQGSPLFDPFLPYADLLAKDRAIQAVRNTKFACQYSYETGYTICGHKPDGGVFSDIFVTLEGDRPAGVTFYTVHHRLRLGHLAALWGKPETTRPGSLRWQNSRTVSALVPSTDRLNYFAPVRVVMFTF